MSILQIRLFGGLALSWNGVPLPAIPSLAARSLLAYLVTYRQRAHMRDRLAGVFWPEQPDKIARHRLSQALWHIRRYLNPHILLQIEGDTIRFAPKHPTWIDLEQFTYHYEAATGTSQVAGSLEHYQDCIALHSAEFMDGYYEDWILPERERLRNMYLAALERLIAGSKSQGKYKQALVHARTLVSQDAWNETGQREVMRLLHLLGRDAEAMLQYETSRQVLLEELGVEPASETQALMAEIAAQSGMCEIPWLPAAAFPSPAPLVEQPERLPLVGRKDELNRLIRQVEMAGRNEGGLILLYGEAGVGKTRLLRELARNAEWRDMRIAWGRCYEMTGQPAYQPLVEVLELFTSLLNGAALDAPWRVELARLVPGISPGETPGELKPGEEGQRLLEAIGRALQVLARAAPTLVILEDAHWMDAASLEAIRYVLPRLGDMALCLVISARREDLSAPQAKGFAALEDTRLPQRLDLPRLALGETAELVQCALELDLPPVNFSARLHEETQGNPFYLTETLRTLIEERLLFRDPGGKWSTPWDETTRDYAELPLPGGVVQSIHRRLARLPAPTREALNLAAVIGRSLSFKLWLRASDHSELDLLETGDELRRRGLFTHANPATTIESLEQDYQFTHDQIRRVCYENLAAPRRRRYHQRVARALRDLAPDQVEALAYHYHAAQDWENTLQYHQLAGQRAWGVYANDKAAAHFNQALQAQARLGGTPDLEREYQLRIGLVNVYDLQGERPAQAHELSTLARLAEALDDDCRRAEVALRQARLAARTSDYPSAIAAAMQATRLASTAGDATIEAESLWEWGWALLLQGEHAAARAQFENSLAFARSARLPRLEADCLHGLGTVGLVTGAYSEAKGHFQKVLEISRQLDIRATAARSLANLGYIATAQGDHAASKAYAEQALRLHREIGDQRGTAIVLQNMADALLAEGDYPAARTNLEQALTMQQAIQAHENTGETLRSLGFLYHQLGDYEQAMEYYQQALAIFSTSGVRWYQGQTLAYLSLLLHHMGEQQAAREKAQHGLKIARQIDDRLALGWLLDCSGHALISLGDLEPAKQAYRQALTLRRAMQETHKTSESLAGLARLALDQDQIIDACAYVDEILRVQDMVGLDGTLEPMRIFLTCYRVLDGCQDERATAVLTQAYQRLMALCANIHEPALERSFLENVAAHRQIITSHQAWQSRQKGAQRQFNLPRQDVPGGRALRSDETIAIAWTLTLPEDDLIGDKATRRRHRLLRLLEEAQVQGAVPSCEHLADALGVSRRTIERDLARMRREQGVLLATRNKMSH